LLPNIDPTQTSTTVPIFDSTGAIAATTLVGKSWPNAPVPNTNPNGIYSLCNGDCSPGNGGITAPLPGAYYPGDPTTNFTPTQALPSCSSSFNAYQLAIAGCVQTPISCGANPSLPVNIDTNPYTGVNGSRDADTVAAAECLIHYTNPGDSDSVDTATANPPFPPLQFVGGNQNPIANAIEQDVMVSDSLVTVPVINTPPGTTPSNPVAVIGFLQIFLNPSATSSLPYNPNAPPASPNQIPAMIVNMTGCGTNATGQPILGNGASPVAVRLISPP
jgi:hypothetical protein